MPDRRRGLTSDRDNVCLHSDSKQKRTGGGWGVFVGRAGGRVKLVLWIIPEKGGHQCGSDRRVGPKITNTTAAL